MNCWQQFWFCFLSLPHLLTQIPTYHMPNASILVTPEGAYIRTTVTGRFHPDGFYLPDLPPDIDQSTLTLWHKGTAVPYRITHTPPLDQQLTNLLPNVPVEILDNNGNIRYRGTFISPQRDYPLFQTNDGHLIILNSLDPFHIRLLDLPPLISPPVDSLVCLYPVQQDSIHLELTGFFAPLTVQLLYRGTLDSTGDRLSLHLFAKIHNASSKTSFPSATVGILIGESLRAKPSKPNYFLRSGSAEHFTPQPAFEYYQYTLPQPITIPSQSTLSYPIFSLPTVPFTKRYHLQVRPFSNIQHHLRPTIELTLINDSLHSLGFPLPAGRFELAQKDRGFWIPLGSTSFPTAAAGDTIRLSTGFALDLQARFYLIDQKVRDSLKRWQIRDRELGLILSNAKPTAVAIDLTLQLPEYGRTVLLDSSVPPIKKTAHQLLFRIPVKAQSQQELRFKIRHINRH